MLEGLTWLLPALTAVKPQGSEGGPGAQRKQVPGSRVGRGRGGRGGCREAGAKLTSSGRGFCRACGLRLPARGFLPLGCRPEASRLDRPPAELCFPPLHP